MSRLRMALKGGKGTVAPLSDHAVREQRLDNIRDTIEQFTFDLGLLIAGHEPSSTSTALDLTSQLQRELRPFLDAGDAMRPDFGAFGDLRIEGELLESSHPVLATLEFDDRCARETVEGRIVPARGRRLRLTLHVALDPVHVIDCAVSEVTDRHG
jgi:hypothetical protein